jgi:hypothetical protein
MHARACAWPWEQNQRKKFGEDQIELKWQIKTRFKNKKIVLRY